MSILQGAPTLTHIAKSVNPQPGDVHINQLLPDVCNAYFQAQGGLHRTFAAYPSDFQSGQFAAISRADSMRNVTALKSPAGGKPQIGVGVTTDSTYTCKVYEAEFPMSAQLAANWSIPLARDMAATRALSRAAYLRRELTWVTSFFTTSIWGTDSTPSVTWDDPTSDPISDIENGIETILKATGFRPNVMSMGYSVWKALKQHHMILARVSAVTNVQTLREVTRQQVAQLFELDEILVGEVTYNTANSGAAISMDFAAGKNALLAYRAPAPSPVDPTAGSMFTWQGLTGSVDGIMIRNGRDERTEEYWYQIKHAEDFKVVDSALGYFFSNCVA